MIAVQPNSATPVPMPKKALRGQVARRISRLAMRMTLQPKSHREAADDSGFRCFHTNRCRISKTAGSFADIAANAAASTASSLQCQARARMATLKIGVKSIAVAPCSRGRYILCRFNVFVGTACASVRMPVSQNLTHSRVNFQSHQPDVMRILEMQSLSQRLWSQRSRCRAICDDLRSVVLLLDYHLP